jgi:hypothetical protein
MLLSMVPTYRGDGTGRPDLPLPPARMPMWRGRRPLKRWRYVAAFSDELMLCVGSARIGPCATGWWAVWDRERRTLHERTWMRRGGVRFDGSRLTVRDGDARLELEVDEGAAVETVCPHGSGWVWTRKQAARPARGRLRLGGADRELRAQAIIDDTAGYHARETAWRWSAGVGETPAGDPVGWNLVTGVNDPAQGSERTVWAGDDSREVGPVTFAEDLSAVRFAEGGELRFTPEATRERHDHLVLFASDYVQPFGTFAGELPGGLRLARGLGVMERHSARW